MQKKLKNVLFTLALAEQAAVLASVDDFSSHLQAVMSAFATNCQDEKMSEAISNGYSSKDKPLLMWSIRKKIHTSLIVLQEIAEQLEQGESVLTEKDVLIEALYKAALLKRHFEVNERIFISMRSYYERHEDEFSSVQSLDLEKIFVLADI